jgi:S-DNA-T family DNA segregation ATPase FtsK/SpoIIIE
MRMNAERSEKVRPVKPFPLWREVGGVLLVLLGLLLALALLTYDASDPSWNNLGGGPAVNKAGATGAVVADLLVQWMGWAAALFPLSFLLLGGLSFSPATREGWLWRCAGAALLTPGSCLLLDLAGGPGAGLGGAAGRVLVSQLSPMLGAAGASLLGLALLAVGFLFLTHVSLLRGARAAGAGLAALWLTLVKLRERSRRHREVEKERAEMDEEETGGPEPRQRRGRVRPPRMKPAPPPEPEQEEFVSFPRVKGRFTLPPLSLLEDADPRGSGVTQEELEANARLLEKKLRDFGVRGRVTEWHTGPVITQYEYEPDAGTRIQQIASRADDLALAMGGVSVRVVERIPGKNAIGIEVPNKARQTVKLREVLKSAAFREGRGMLKLALGRDAAGAPCTTDLDTMPHMLVAGATGTGKSVCVNSMILSLLYNLTPEDVRFIMVDPKMLELSPYEGIPHLLSPVVTERKKAAAALRWTVREMERRYQLMNSHKVRDLDRYNEKAAREHPPEGDDRHLARIVVVIDEVADLMVTTPREVEECIMRLGQMARAAGIHLILATQRPTVDVISGNVKNNITGRIAFKVFGRGDSRVILDDNGAESLLGKGDMLFTRTSLSSPVRIQGAYVSEEEVSKTVSFLRRQAEPEYRDDMFAGLAGEGEGGEGEEFGDDEKYGEVLDFACERGQVSASMIQRRFKVGYNRAARMVERMEAEGIVSPADGARPRQIIRRGDVE